MQMLSSIKNNQKISTEHTAIISCRLIKIINRKTLKQSFENLGFLFLIVI